MTSLQWSEAKEELLSFHCNAAVSASAGTGKTTALSEFVVRQLSPDSSCDIEDLQNLVAITYTEKAAGELKERIQDFILSRMEEEGEKHVRFWERMRRSLSASYIGTIHSICSRVLRENALRLGLDPTFDVIDERYAESMLSQLILQFIVQQVRQEDERMQRLLQSFGFDEIGFQRQDLQQVFYGLLEQFWNNGYRVEHVRNLMNERFQEAEIQLEKAVEQAFQHVEDILALSEQDLTEKSADRLRTFRSVAGEVREFLHDVKEMDVRMSDFSRIRQQAGSILKGHMSKALKERSSRLRSLLGAPLSSPEPGKIQKLVSFLFSRKLHRDLLSSLQDIESRFQQQKRNQGVVDFHDLLFFTRDLLRGDPQVRKQYKEQFHFILVDEFQDVNQLQFEILYLLSETLDRACSLAEGDSVLDRVSLQERSFVAVGDVKQSIYRFRGADVSVFQEVLQKIENERGKQFSFRENFRSTPGVISFLNDFSCYMFPEAREDETDQKSQSREGHQVRFSDDDQLLPTRDEIRTDEPSVELLSPPVPSGSSDEMRKQEARALVSRIQDFVDHEDVLVEKENGETGAPGYGDVAILFRSMTHLAPYERAFREADVPYRIFRGKDFYETPELRDMANMFRFLRNPHDAIAMFGFLKSPMVGVIEDTVLLLKQVAEQQYDGSVLDAFLEWEGEELDSEEQEKLHRARETFSYLYQYKDLVLPDELVREILERTNYTAVFLEDTRYEQIEANLEKLMGILRKRRENERSVTFEQAEEFLRQAVANRTPEEEASVQAGERDKVQLMSIHSAKGLEFPVVCLADMGSVRVRVQGPCLFEPDWGIGVRWRDPETDIQHDTWSHDRVRDEMKKKEKAEFFRLLYVAMTRTRDYLVCSGWYQRQKRGTWWYVLDQYLQQFSEVGLEDLLEEQNPEQREEVITIQGKEETFPLRVVQKGDQEQQEEQPQSDSREETSRQDIQTFLEQQLTDFEEGSSPITYEGPEASEADGGNNQFPPLTYSVTELLELLRCERRFSFLFRENIPEDVGTGEIVPEEDFEPYEWQKMGQLAHDLLERLSLDEELSQAQLERIVRYSESGKLVSPTGVTEVVDAVRNCYAQFLQPFVQDGAGVQREVSFATRWNIADSPLELVLEGKTDLLLETDNSLFIVDYKFARNRAEKFADDRLQLLLYALAKREVFQSQYPDKSLRCGIYYLREETRDEALRDMTPGKDALEQFRKQVDQAVRTAVDYRGEKPMDWPHEEDVSVCKQRRCGFVSFCHEEDSTSFE